MRSAFMNAVVLSISVADLTLHKIGSEYSLQFCTQWLHLSRKSAKMRRAPALRRAGTLMLQCLISLSTINTAFGAFSLSLQVLFHNSPNSHTWSKSWQLFSENEFVPQEEVFRQSPESHSCRSFEVSEIWSLLLKKQTRFCRKLFWFSRGKDLLRTNFRLYLSVHWDLSVCNSRGMIWPN